MRNFKKYTALFIVSAVFTVLSVYFHGYSFGLGDQAIHIPIILKYIDSSIYPRDILFRANQGDYSLYYPLLAILIKAFSGRIEVVFFCLYIAIDFLFYFMLGLLAKKFFKSILGVIIFLSMFVYPIFIGGSAIQSLEISFVPRFIAFTGSLYVLFFILNRRWSIAVVLSLLVFMVHPITFIYLAIVGGLYICISRDWPNRKLMFFFVLALISVSILMIYRTNGLSFTSIHGSLFPGWIEIVRSRNSYAFLDLWSLRAWISTAGISFLLLSGVLYRFKNIQLAHILSSTFSASILALFIQYVFVTIVPISGIIAIQMSRIWIFGFFGACLVATKFILSLNQKFIFFYLLVIFSLLFYQKSNPIYKMQNNSWIDVQLWIKSHTSKNCIILTPFDHQGFRIYSMRMPVAEYKDGTLSFYSESFSFDWESRKNDLLNFSNLDESEIKQLGDKYKTGLLLTEGSKYLPFSIIYDNKSYKVYSLKNIYSNQCLEM